MLDLAKNGLARLLFNNQYLLARNNFIMVDILEYIHSRRVNIYW